MSELEKKFAQRGTGTSKLSILRTIYKLGTSDKPFNPYVEFPEFTRKEIKNYETTFKTYDTSKDGFLGIFHFSLQSLHIDMMELKYMMEKLGLFRRKKSISSLRTSTNPHLLKGNDQGNRRRFRRQDLIQRISSHLP